MSKGRRGGTGGDVMHFRWGTHPFGLRLSKPSV